MSGKPAKMLADQWFNDIEHASSINHLQSVIGAITQELAHSGISALFQNLDSSAKDDLYIGDVLALVKAYKSGDRESASKLQLKILQSRDEEKN